METTELIEWIEFQFNFKMTDIAKISIKNKLESYTKKKVVLFCKWLTQHGHNLTDHQGMYNERYDEWNNQ